MSPFFKVPKLGSIALFLLFLFLFIFPKGGIKISGNPITIGYFLALTFSFFLILKRFSLQNSHLLKSGLALIFFQLSSLFSILLNGWKHPVLFISFVLHFFVFPIIVFFLLSSDVSESIYLKLFKWIRHGVFFLASFGIFLFFYKLLKGSFIEIPFLTVNYHDLNTLETSKCIDRGRFFKLISTYNNGNLYGICLLMVYPLFHKLEKNTLKKIIVLLSLILTLSRTVWIGALAAIFFELFSKSKKSFLMKRLFLFLSLLSFIIATTMSMDFKLDFFFDKSLGNRIDQFYALRQFSLFGSEPFDGIHEITFLGIYKSFGLIGLISFYLGLIYPIYLMLSPEKHQDVFQKRIAFGLLLYHFISLSDGALLFIPVMALYWSLCYFGLNRNLENQSLSKASSV